MKRFVGEDAPVISYGEIQKVKNIKIINRIRDKKIRSVTYLKRRQDD